jgi:hypothetical protein
VRLELGDEPGMSTAGELGLDPVLQRVQAKLFETEALDAGEGLLGKFRERRPSPESESLAQSVSRASRVATRLGKKVSETSQVELLWLELEDVARTAARRHPAAERLPKTRHIHLHRLCGVGRRRLPERVDELFGGDDLVRVQ